MDSKRFQRHIENFNCENCGQAVQGDGYTNHCPECLWSRHVDCSPGDRKNSCQGMMKPIEIIIKADQRWVLHECVDCGEQKRVKLLENDNFERQLEIMRGSGGAE